MTWIIILRDGSTIRFENIKRTIDDHGDRSYFILVDMDNDWIYVVKNSVAVIYMEK